MSGRFTAASGGLSWHSDGTAAVRLDVVAASIATGIAFRDRHLRSPEFLDTEHFPTITFAGAARCTAAGTLGVTGRLTVRGVTCDEAIDVQIDSNGHEYTGSASTSLDLASYGIRPRLGVVRPTVRLTMAGRLVRAQAPGPLADA